MTPGLWYPLFAGRLLAEGASMKVFLAGLLTIMSLTAAGSTKAAELKSGDPAPPFKLQGSDGKVHDLAQLAGKTVVLAWFPKAFTGG